MSEGEWKIRLEGVEGAQGGACGNVLSKDGRGGRGETRGQRWHEGRKCEV